MLYQSVGVVGPEHHHVYGRRVVGHTDSVLWSVLNIVISDHSRNGSAEDLRKTPSNYRGKFHLSITWKHDVVIW